MPIKERDRTGNERRRKSAFDQLDAIFEETCGRLLVQRRAREVAHRRAQSLLVAGHDEARFTGLALLTYTSGVVLAHAVELAANQAELSTLIARVEAAGLVSRISLAQGVLQSPDLLQLPTAVALEVQLGLLAGFVDAADVSLWTLRADGELREVAHVGEFDAGRMETRRLARRILGSEAKAERPRSVVGIRLEVRGRPAAVIARGKSSGAGRKLLLETAAAVLVATMERQELMQRRGHSPDSVLAAAERRLARLRFDLHDGPQQDVLLLAEDLSLLRSQLDAVMDGAAEKSRILGHVDDLQARLVAIDGDLRRISAFVQSPFLRDGSVTEALAKLAEEFATRTAIEPAVTIEGDFASLSDSQQVTLLGLVREALSNVREHSGAEHVSIFVVATSTGVEATITDDGRGFDPETTLVDAARAGHLGLVGMHERVRMLGGSTRIDSRPGGPTVISVALPPFAQGGV